MECGNIYQRISTAIYILDLGGNARKGLKVSNANVFGIRVGVSINLFIKNKQNPSEKPNIFYHRTDDLWNKEKKFNFLDKHQHIGNIEWNPIQPNKQHTWLTEGLHAEFDTFIPMGTKEAKAQKGIAENVVFKTYSNGIKTNRDVWVYNFNRNALTENVEGMIGVYNAEVDRWKRRENQRIDVRDFVVYDDSKIKWDQELRRHLQRSGFAEWTERKVRTSLYRPFTKSNLFFDRVLNNRVYLLPSIFPTPDTEAKNKIICVAGIGNRKSFGCLTTNNIPALDLAFEKAQCFPFYTYDEDGTNRRENIT